MFRIPVESSSIATIGYDPASKELNIEFKESGEIYPYFEVPPAAHEALMNAPSKGTCLNQQFKQAGYRYERRR